MKSCCKYNESFFATAPRGDLSIWILASGLVFFGRFGIRLYVAAKAGVYFGLSTFLIDHLRWMGWSSESIIRLTLVVRTI